MSLEDSTRNCHFGEGRNRLPSEVLPHPTVLHRRDPNQYTLKAPAGPHPNRPPSTGAKDHSAAEPTVINSATSPGLEEAFRLPCASGDFMDRRRSIARTHILFAKRP